MQTLTNLSISLGLNYNDLLVRTTKERSLDICHTKCVFWVIALKAISIQDFICKLQSILSYFATDQNSSINVKCSMDPLYDRELKWQFLHVPLHFPCSLLSHHQSWQKNFLIFPQYSFLLYFCSIVHIFNPSQKILALFTKSFSITCLLSTFAKHVYMLSTQLWRAMDVYWRQFLCIWVLDTVMPVWLQF